MEVRDSTLRGIDENTVRVIQPLSTTLGGHLDRGRCRRGRPIAALQLCSRSSSGGLFCLQYSDGGAYAEGAASLRVSRYSIKDEQPSADSAPTIGSFQSKPPPPVIAAKIMVNTPPAYTETINRAKGVKYLAVAETMIAVTRAVRHRTSRIVVTLLVSSQSPARHLKRAIRQRQLVFRQVVDQAAQKSRTDSQDMLRRLA